MAVTSKTMVVNDGGSSNGSNANNTLPLGNVAQTTVGPGGNIGHVTPNNSANNGGNAGGGHSGHSGSFTEATTPSGSGVVSSGVAGAIAQGATNVVNNLNGGGTPPSTSSGTGGGNGGGGNGPGGGGNGGTNENANLAPAAATDPYAAAAATTNRLTQGVDMSEQIRQANEAWSNVNSNYGDTSNGLIDSAGQQMGNAVDQYAGESQQIIDQLKGISDEAIANYAANSGQTIAEVKARINDILNGLEGVQNPNVSQVGRVDTVEQENLLAQMMDAARQQQIGQINYGTQQGVNELERSVEDAAPKYQTMRNQIAANEQTALDNQALYAEMRGDRGGIGQSQYGSIQNTAATNQLAVNREQTKLSTDVARQIADLRAQGEFKIADALLQLAQSELSQLMQMKQWADTTNVGIDEFNVDVEKWKEEYAMKAQELLANTKLAATEYAANLDLQNAKYTTEQTLANAQQNANLNLSRSESLNQQRHNLSQ